VFKFARPWQIFFHGRLVCQELVHSLKLAPVSIESLFVRLIDPDGPEIRTLRDWSGAELASDQVYTPQEIERMHAVNGYIASWLLWGRCQIVAALAADLDGRVIGGIQLLQRDDDEFAVLEFLYVKKELRGNGVANRLIGEAATIAHLGGYSTLEVNTVLREPRAIAFWERFFRPMTSFGSRLVPGAYRWAEAACLSCFSRTRDSRAFTYRISRGFGRWSRFWEY